MNRLKVRSLSGMVSHINLKQKRDNRKYPFNFQEWDSPAAAKARVVRMGATLLGKRQS